MTDVVTIEKFDDVHIRLRCNDGILRELAAQFQFLIPNAKFNPKVRNGTWDGRIRLLSVRDAKLYYGLKPDVIEYCNRNGYVVNDATNENITPITYEEIELFTKTLNLPVVPRDYQIQACVDIINNSGRGIVLSPTGSGKSLILYIIQQYYKDKTLIIVPTKILVNQMSSDFKDYGYNFEISKIMNDKGVSASKENLQRVTCSTWQSIYKMPATWFNQFKVVICDEAHTCTATSLISIMEKCHNTIARIGTTGTLTNEDSKVNEMVLRGLFGTVFTTRTTRELIDSGDLSDIKIQAIRIDYPEEIRKAAKNAKYEYSDEMEYLYTSDKRQQFIVNLAGNLKGNTLILFKKISQGKEIFEKLQKQYPDKEIRFVYHKVSAADRDEVRSTMEENDNIIGVCSYATFATGVNIKNLHNLIFAAPMKGSIKVLQAIGRTLRLHMSKSKAKLFDIGDDLTYGKQYKNHAWRHFQLRLEYYVKAQLDFTIREISL